MTHPVLPRRTRPVRRAGPILRRQVTQMTQAAHRVHLARLVQCQKRMTLKLIPPTKYDGSVDLKAFHRFIMEGTAYVKDGRVPSRKQAFILSHYLTGKAHEFYVREVSGNPYGWHLPEFFRELFNYCFPVDFRIKQQRKLLHCYQNDQKV